MMIQTLCFTGQTARISSLPITGRVLALRGLLLRDQGAKVEVVR